MSSSPPHRPPTASDVFSRPPPTRLPQPPPPPPTQPAAPSLPLPPPPRARSPLRSTTPIRQTQELSMDELCDIFLRGPSPRLDQGLEPLVEPPFVSKTKDVALTEFERIQSAARRRSWSVVVTLAHPLLHGSSHYAPLFESLMTPGKQQSSILALQTHQEELVLILQWLLQALVATGSRAELTRTLQSWTFLYHHNHQKSTTAVTTTTTTTTAPSWIPWSLHIYAAAALQHTTTTTDAVSTSALDALWELSSDIPRANAKDRYEVENAISNVCVALQEWRLALGSLERMIGLINEEEEEEEEEEDGCSEQKKMDILSRQGRILLQAGALEGAEAIFEQVADMKSAEKSSIYCSALIPANEGLLKFSKGLFETAMDCFVEAINIMRPTIHSSTTLRNQQLYSDTVNNMALAALYSCRLDEALRLMESLVRADPAAFLTDRVAMNLCTLYELASDAAQASRKKRVLAAVAKRFALDDIRPECFRVN